LSVKIPVNPSIVYVIAGLLIRASGRAQRCMDEPELFYVLLDTAVASMSVTETPRYSHFRVTVTE